jgi:hypothetical protein
VLAGPPGSGKWTAIQTAAAEQQLRIKEVSIDTACAKKAAYDLMLARGMVMDNRGNLYNSVTVLFGLECVTRDANVVLQEAWAHERCIVHINNPTGLIVQPPARLIYAKGFSWDSLDKAISQIEGHQMLTFEHRAALKRADGMRCGGIRRVKLPAEALIMTKRLGGDLDSQPDTAVHRYFNSLRFVRGERLATLPADKIKDCSGWIRANVARKLSLEDAATFAQTMAENDAYSEMALRALAGDDPSGRTRDQKDECYMHGGEIMQLLGMVLPRTRFGQ